MTRHIEQEALSKFKALNLPFNNGYLTFRIFCEYHYPDLTDRAYTIFTQRFTTAMEENE